MKESIEKRIEAVRTAETSEDLKTCVCPFFERGGSPDCISCRRTDADLEDCRDYYLERIAMMPMEVWSEEFNSVRINTRETVKLEDVVGVGVNCDNCYMYDKCPLYKKGYTCAIDWGSGRPNTPTEFMDFLINTQYERVRRSSVFEKIDGGVPDVGLSGEIDRLHNLIASKADMGRDKLSISVEASSSGGGKSSGGILAKLFGGGSLPESNPTTTIPESASSREGIAEVADFEEVKEPEKVGRKRKK